MFLVSLVIDAFASNTTSPISVAAVQYAGTLLGAVALVHIAERLWWHVVWDRPFPDFLRKPAT